MNPIGWMHRKFKQNNDEKIRNISSGKFVSCFATLWEVGEQQPYHETKRNSAQFWHPRVFPVNEEETNETTPEFFHGFLSIGTLGSESITNDTIITKAAMPFEIANEKENKTEENERSSLENPSNKDTKDNKNIAVCQIKECFKEENEQKTKPDNLFKKIVTYKRSEAQDKEVKRKTRSIHFMKKMLKKLDFTSRCKKTSAGGNAICRDSTDKKPTTKTFQESRKIHPGEADLHVTKPHNYKVDKICYYEGYDKEVTMDQVNDIRYPRSGILLKETVSSCKEFANKPPFNSPTNERKAHWIKTDADYFVLEF